MTKQLTRGPNKGMRNLISASANLTKFRVWYYAAWFTEYILCIDRPTHQVQDVGSVWSTEPEVDSVIIESPTSGPFCRVTIVNMSSNWFRPKWKKKTNISVTELVFYSSARWIREEKKKVMRNVKLSALRFWDLICEEAVGHNELGGIDILLFFYVSPRRRNQEQSNRQNILRKMAIIPLHTIPCFL